MWMNTFSGRKFDLADPDPRDIEILDIAVSLSNICRFAGQCGPFYSVAEHSVFVSRQLPLEVAMEGLLHDATEAYIGDIPYPVKRMLGTAIQEIEHRVYQAIALRFGLSLKLPESVHRADMAVFIDEWTRVVTNPACPWTEFDHLKGYQPAGIRNFAFLRPDKAVNFFLNEYKYVLGGR